MTTIEKTTLPNGEDLFLGDHIVFDHSTGRAGHWVVEEIAGDGYITARGTVATTLTPTEHVSTVIRIPKKNQKARAEYEASKVTEDSLLDAPVKSVLSVTVNGVTEKYTKEEGGLWTTGPYSFAPETILFFTKNATMKLTIPERETIIVDKDKLLMKIEALRVQISDLRDRYESAIGSHREDLYQELRRARAYRNALLAVREGIFS